MTGLPKKVYIDVVGCPENRFDAAQTRALFVSLGVHVTSNIQDADIVVINTCGLTQGTEKVSLEILRMAQYSMSSNARLIITGCLPKINLTALEKFKDTLIIGGPLYQSFPWSLPEEVDTESVFCPLPLGQRITLGEKKQAWNFRKGIYSNLDQFLYRYINVMPPGMNVYAIKVASGCNLVCSYCAVKISRGHMCSRPIEWVVAKFKEGLESGYRNFALLGTNVSAYGQDIRINFIDLAKRLFELDEASRFRLRNMEPREIIRYLDDFAEILKTKRITYLEFPLESGSDRILRLMQRGYTIDEFVTCLAAMKNAFPSLIIRSQIMVGFPSESDEDFEQTRILARSLPIDYIEVYNFSPRPGTKAFSMEERVSKKVAKQRYETLRRELMRTHLPHKIKIFLHQSRRSLHPPKQA